MATRTQLNVELSINQAMALLIKNQAALVAQHTSFLNEREESRKAFARMEKEFELIKAILLRHETMLERLPEAIREKIAYKA